MSQKNQPTLEYRLHMIHNVFWEIGQFFSEIFKGYRRQDEVLFRYMVLAVVLGGLIIFRCDVWLFKRVGLWGYYPADGWIFRSYAVGTLFLPVIMFGLRRRQEKREFSKNLKEVFDLAGLKNAIGTYPNFLSLDPMTGGTMKLCLTNGSFPLGEWQKRKERLEASMKIYIDEIKQVPEKGIIEMTFSHDPMPTKVTIENIRAYRDYKFLIGRDRSKTYIGDFADSPHFLVAGETGGGKSAFLRQLFTTIKINQPEAEFHMVDMKGGVEFGYLEKVPGVKVITEVAGVPAALGTITAKIDIRIQKLKERNLTDIKYFFKTDEYNRMTVAEKTAHDLGRRVFVVVDECAEIFLFGLGHNAAFTREIRAHMSRITRLGRAVGIHVILATQRPDKNAIDPQVKTNLTSTICFRVQDHGASLAILGTGRATDLPVIQGRIILRTGSDEMEIQTPFLEPKDSINLLENAFNISLDAEVLTQGEPASIKETADGKTKIIGPSHSRS